MLSVDQGKGEALTLHLDPIMVGRAFYCAVVGALAAVTLFEQRRMTRNKRVAKIVTVAAAISLGFTGICCPALAIQNALVLTLPSDGRLIEVAVYPLAECVMFCLGIALPGVALEVGTWDSFFATTSEERSTILALDMKHMSIRDLRRGGTVYVFLKALSSRPKYLLMGGLLLGVSLPLTQCLALLALVPSLPDPELSMVATVDWGIVTASVLTSTLCSMCTFWVLIRLLQWRHNLESVRLCTTILFGVLVTAMNILSCRSVTFHLSRTQATASTRPSAGAYTVLTYAVAASIVWCITVLYTIIYKVRTAFWTANKDVGKVIDLLQQGGITDLEIIHMLAPHASEDKKNSLQEAGLHSPSPSRTSSIRQSIAKQPSTSSRRQSTAPGSPTATMTLQSTRRQSSITMGGSPSLRRVSSNETMGRTGGSSARPSLKVRTSLPPEAQDARAQVTVPSPTSSLFRQDSPPRPGDSPRRSHSMASTATVQEEPGERDSLQLTSSPLAGKEALSPPMMSSDANFKRSHRLPPLAPKAGSTSPKAMRTSKVNPLGVSYGADSTGSESASSGGSEQRQSDSAGAGGSTAEPAAEPATGPHLV